MQNRLTKKQLSLVAITCALVSCVVFATYVLAFENISPTKLSFTPSFKAMTISWDTYQSQLATTTSLYAIYRADDATGANFVRVGVVAGDATSYTDTFLKPGESYSYAVVNGQGRDGLDNVSASSLTWSAVQTVPLVGGKDAHGNTQASPHAGADLSSAARNQKGCNKCHVIHDAAASAQNLITTNQSATEPNASTALCESCHMSNGASEKSDMQAALSQTSGHTIKNAQNPNGLFDCTTCHGAHQSSKSTKGALLPSTIKKFGKLTQDVEVDGKDANAQCVGCHDDKHTWYSATQTGAYPSTSNPSKLKGQPSSTGMNNFPVSGTFPGKSIANSPTDNPHANIAASGDYDKGDCRYCHSSHANGQEDQLLTSRGELRAMKTVGGVVPDEEKTSGAYASFCLSCHNSSNKGTPWAAAKDVSASFMVLPGSTEASRTAFLKSNAGHRISSTNGDLPAGSSLPCYACHNPHGSSTNALDFSDELGTNLKDNDDFCYTCHVTSDGYVCEDGNAGTVVKLADAQRQTVYGLSRSGSDGSNLKLSAIEGHEKGSTTSCSTCHGDSHKPNDYSNTCCAGDKNCTECHTSATGEYSAASSYTSATHAKANTANTTAYRWTTTHTAHLIPAWKSIASNDASATGVYCTGCHGWATPSSSTFSLDGRSVGSTLRNAFNGSSVANTDFLPTTTDVSGGLCLSCHTAGNAASAPTSGTTNALNALTAADYSSCYHNYTVPITRNAKANGESSKYTKTFNANCEKCHNNAEPIADPANNKDKLLLNPHYKDKSRLLANFGIRADISKPVGHDDILTTTCDSCHGAGKTNVAHAGKRSGRCFEGCHSPEEIYSITAHQSLSWYSSCQTCHSTTRKPTTHVVAPAFCSTTTCHSDMSTHVTANAGQCYSGCHSPGDILNTKNSDGTLAHSSSMNSFKTCSSCHTTNGSSAWTRTMNTRGMCFGCHARKGNISGAAGKSYVGKDWYGVATMNKAETDWTPHTYISDSQKSYVQKEYKNASGSVIGTQYYDEEGIFDDMYNTSNSYASGDGTGGSADTAAKNALLSGMEVAGHQPNRAKNTWSSLTTLKPHIQKNTSSIRCSECHNTHATSKGSMGGHTDWVLTKKALPGKTGGVQSTTYTDTSGTSKTTTVYPDNTMPTGAIAADGSRLITLNDFWSRNELATPVKNAIVAYYTTYYQTANGGSMTASDAAVAAQAKYDQMDYDGITAAQVATCTGTSETVGLAAQWGKTVDIFCYRCHDEKSMANKAHQGTTTWFNDYSHKSASLACVNCHLPEVHGGKLAGLLSDRGAYDSDGDGIADANDSSSASVPSGMTAPYKSGTTNHKPLSKNQEFRWVAYQHGGTVFNSVNTSPKVLGNNQPATLLFSVNPDPSSDNEWSYGGCSTDKSCHVNGVVTRYFGEQSGGTWLNWTSGN